MQWKETWRFRTERKRCHFTLSQCTAAVLLLSLDLSSCSPPLSLRLSVCVCARACVSVHTCTQTYGSHVFPYKDWLWEELMRNEQNYSTGTPLFLSLFFFVVFLVPGYNMSPCFRFYSHLYIHFSVYPVFFLKHILICFF